MRDERLPVAEVMRLAAGHQLNLPAPLKLAIEFDGGQHALQEERDAARTGNIARHGHRVVRFWSSDVVDNLPGVLEIIRQELEAVHSGNTLSALQGGEGGARAKGAGE